VVLSRLPAAAALAFGLAACTAVPFDAPRTATRALPAEGTPMAASARHLTGGAPDRVALVPLVDGNDALGARLDMIEAAHRSIDIKTFLIKPDKAGTLFWLELYKAAERGVRVRLLFDDVFTTTRDDQIAQLDAHPNVEIRVFNPLSRNSTLAGNFLLDFDRVNRRMHNKAFITDGAMAIIGGRNIADEYYQINTSHEFADFDLFVAGEPVRQISEAFDLYWSDEWSVPFAAIARTSDASLAAAVAAFEARADAPEVAVYDRAINSTYLADVGTIRAPVLFGTAEVVVDDPAKLRVPPGKGPYHVGETLFQTMNRAEREVIVFTPYFVPEDYGAAFFERLAARGVRVRIVTNSLASTNHPYVHGGYARYRERLLDAGVEILEVRADAPKLVGGHDTPLTMHTKLAVIDDRTVFVGSPNIDPRSIRQNTEFGMVIDSPDLARGILAGIEVAAPDHAFRVVRQGDGLRWIYEGSSGREVFDTEPGASWGAKLVAAITRMLPVEPQL
jgi:putative cardiolipin synthase